MTSRNQAVGTSTGLEHDTSLIAVEKDRRHREHKRWDSLASEVTVRYVEPTMKPEDVKLPPGCYPAKSDGYCLPCGNFISKGTSIRFRYGRMVHQECS